MVTIAEYQQTLVGLYQSYNHYRIVFDGQCESATQQGIDHTDWVNYPDIVDHINQLHAMMNNYKEAIERVESIITTMQQESQNQS